MADRMAAGRAPGTTAGPRCGQLRTRPIQPGTSSSLRDYWKDQPAFKPPMTSLRDVDEAGYIVAAARDPLARGRTTDVDRRDLAKVMKAIRTQRGSASEMDADGGNDG